MAKPRVFISSTFYDLRQVRADLEMFVRDLGYEPVLNERGSIPYPADEKLQDSAYREVGLSDIVVSVIGGRFGHESDQVAYSVSQRELKTAIADNKQVYIFVQQAVLSEYQTYLANKDSEHNVKYSFVDDARIYGFLEEVHALRLNNAISGFETARDITEFLRSQWAGLFHGMLQERRRADEVRLIEELNASAATLRTLVAFLTDERASRDEAIQQILLASHPLFGALKRLLHVGYRVYFTNLAEMTSWLAARSYKPVEHEEWDEEGIREWSHPHDDAKQYDLLKISGGIFEPDGRLRIYSDTDWDDAWVTLERRKYSSWAETDDDDIPF